MRAIQPPNNTLKHSLAYIADSDSEARPTHFVSFSINGEEKTQRHNVSGSNPIWLFTFRRPLSSPWCINYSRLQCSTHKRWAENKLAHQAKMSALIHVEFLSYSAVWPLVANSSPIKFAWSLWQQLLACWNLRARSTRHLPAGADSDGSAPFPKNASVSVKNAAKMRHLLLLL